MAEQLSAEQRATELVVQYGRDATLHDTRQWIELVVQAAEKQRGAEVLATQREYLDRYQKFTELPEELRPYVEQVNKIVTEIRALVLGVQPAASHLEELLEEARRQTRDENPNRYLARCPDCGANL